MQIQNHYTITDYLIDDQRIFTYSISPVEYTFHGKKFQLADIYWGRSIWIYSLLR